MKIDEICTELAWYTSKDGTLTLSPKTGPILMCESVYAKSKILFNQRNKAV